MGLLSALLSTGPFLRNDFYFYVIQVSRFENEMFDEAHVEELVKSLGVWGNFKEKVELDCKILCEGVEFEEPREEH